MNIPGFAIRNHQFTVLASIILVLLGIVSYLTMPRSEDPQFDFPGTLITVVNPGTAPEDMEKLIVDPIESSINELEDIKTLKTNIEDGLAIINVEFLYGSDPDEKYDDVVTALGRVRDDLPEGIVKLEARKISPSEVNILQLALTSEYPNHVEMRQTAEKLEKRLERISGVMRVDIDALVDMEVQVEVDPISLAALNLSLDDVLVAVSSAAKNAPAGHTRAGERRFTIKSSGDFKTIEQIENTVVRGMGDSLIYLRDIAQVQFDPTLPSYRAIYKDKSAVFVSVVQRQGTQIFAVMESIDQALVDFSRDLPSGIEIETVMRQSDSVETRVSSFFGNLQQGLALVGLLTLLVLGAKPALVVVVAIPISIFIAIGWLDFTGFGLQQMSIVGLVIALGLLVDNAIVVTDNILRQRKKGLSRSEAAIKGGNQVATAIASGTFTTILAFVPMLMLQNGSGTFMRSMPVTVVLTLLASLIVALTLTPYLVSLLKSKVDSNGKTEAETTRTQQKLSQFSESFYEPWLKAALRRPKTVMFSAVIIFVSSIALFPLIGVSLFPKAEKPMILVNLELPEGGSFERTEFLAERLSDQLNQESLVTSIATNLGRGNPRVYYNENPNRQTVTFAQLFVKLNTSDLNEVEPFVERLRKDLNIYPGAKVTIKEFKQGPPTEAPISIRVLGENLKQVQKVSLDVEQIIAQTEGTTSVDNPIGKNKIDLSININRDKASMLGIPLDRIDRMIRATSVGIPMGVYKDELGDDYPIVLRTQSAQLTQIEAFDDLRIRTGQGQLVPFDQIASLELATGLARFQHYNLERMARVTADVRPGFNIEAITNGIIDKLDQYQWPEGVSYRVGGEQESRKESFGGMLQSLIVAMLGIFAVLVMQFRSFVQPLIVFTAIPFAMTGSFLGLFLTGYTFSFTAFIGLTSLVGIVVNNSIILVDYANNLISHGRTVTEAVIESAKSRMTPILLTTATTIGGLLPLTLTGSSMWSPMGVAIIAGLLVSTLLTLFLVPVLFQWFTSDQNSSDINESSKLNTALN